MYSGKKNIVYIGGFDLPDNNAAAQRVVSNAKIFRELGYEVFFIGITHNKDDCLKDQQYFEGFSYLNLAYPNNLQEWLRYLTTLKSYLPYLNKLAPNIVIAYNMPAIALNSLRKWTYRNRAFLFADCTEWYLANGNLLFRLIKGLDTFYRMKRVHLKVDGMITISKYLYDFYKSKVTTTIRVPPLVDLEMEKWKANDIACYSKDSLCIVYAGSPGTGNKDKLDVILDVLSRLINNGVSNFVFTVIGITKEQYEKSFDTKCPDNLNKYVTFKGRLSHIEALNEVKKAHFNLFIRDNTLVNNAGFPTKLVESIACGTPVITNKTSNIADYVHNGINGFLLEDISEKAMVQILSDVMSLEMDKVVEMKNNCLQSRMFDFKQYIPQFAKLVNQLDN